MIYTLFSRVISHAKYETKEIIQKNAWALERARIYKS
nr:MAG TPA: hypothetical protein [Caudoviricetes sp.]